eukprot:gnl/Chilomastix_caulleri/5428.p1 GENE.gnl/Chilomastix_caulleri/5428~~gnl/Chilomastix_caulleri/5428.p1  ORF type:complete len:106 (-),score=19.18 gnl/Chilomastix_caulleri/5428:237-527(-)
MAVAPPELDFIIDLLKSNVRMDSRGIKEEREVLISPGCLRSFCGSCVSTLGDTRCVCTLTASLGSVEDRPIMVDVRLSPLSCLLSGMNKKLRNATK